MDLKVLKCSPPKIGFLLNAVERNLNKESSFCWQGLSFFLFPLDNVGEREPESMFVFWIWHIVRFVLMTMLNSQDRITEGINRSI